MKSWAAMAVLTLLVFPAVAEEQCYGKVEVGDSVAQLRDRCGEPMRRERKATGAAGGVQVIRGMDSFQTRPLNPEIMEKWYYDTSLDEATVVEVIDGRVDSVRKLLRGTHTPMEMD